MSRHVAASLAGLAVLCTVAGCGTETISTSSAPPALRLVDNGGSTPAAPAMAGGTAGGFELRTTLPSAQPAPAAVYQLPRATVADATTVARALGVTGQAVAVRGGWAARDGTQLLAVRADGSWTYGVDCNPSQPLTAESLDVMCGSASTATAIAVPAPSTGGRRAAPPPSMPPPPPAGPDAIRTRALATPILQRLALTPASTSVSVGAPTSTFTADMTVDGLLVPDRLTMFAFDRSDTLVSGNGWVGKPARGRAYPLIDAARAFTVLRDQPRPMPLICRPMPGREHSCAPWPATVIIGARLGLALRHDATRALLVPAWLFTVQNSPWPLAVVAVEPRYLLAPSSTGVPPRPMPPGKASSGSSDRG